MSFDSNNPFESPRAASAKAPPRPDRVVDYVMSSIVFVALIAYVIFTLMLLFTGSWDDKKVGGLFLFNWPVLGLWLHAAWIRSARAFLFGLLAIAFQLGISLAIFVVMQGVDPDEVFAINGPIIFVFVVVILMIRWVQIPRIRQESVP